MSEDDNQEIKCGRAPEKEIDPTKIGVADLKKPDEDNDEEEVGGRAVVKHAMKCFKCNAVSWIDYDTENYKAYRCAPCGAVNVL